MLNSGLPKHKIDAEFLWSMALSLEGSDLQSAAAYLTDAEEICCNLASAHEVDDIHRFVYDKDCVQVAIFRRGLGLCQLEQVLGGSFYFTEPINQYMAMGSCFYTPAFVV